MSDQLTPVVDAVRARFDEPGGPVVVGIAGAVSVGKSKFAEAIGAALASGPGAPTTAVVSTDDFLLPNAVLAERGLSHRKGFPESYDGARLRAFVADVRAGRPLHIPVYSHQVYDIVVGEYLEIERADVFLVEGVNALGALHGLLDLGIYVDADPDDVEAWYVARFRRLTDAARDDPGSFYGAFSSMTDDELDGFARHVWREVNLVNLREHIEPSRVDADFVVMMATDHSVRAVRMSEEGDRGGV